MSKTDVFKEGTAVCRVSCHKALTGQVGQKGNLVRDLSRPIVSVISV